MATFMNYSSLVADVTNYLERGASLSGDQVVTNQIPRLINAAERKIMQTLKMQGTLEVLIDNAGLMNGQPIVAKPDRWRQTVSMFYGAGGDLNQRTPLFPRSYEYCRTYWPDDTVTSSSAPPLFYADYDFSHWLIVPTPYQTFPLEVLSYLQPQLLDANNQNNWLTEYAPNLLLYSALLEAAPFLKNDARIATWQAWVDREMSTISGQDLQKILDRAAERSRP